MAAPDALLATLDPDQRAAATHPGDGPLEIIAGAGTGKTRVLVARVAWLVATGRARPEEVCAVAFMNDAARQIRARLATVLGEAVARRVWVGTSHRLAVRVLRGQAARFARAARFSIWDEHDVDAALAAIPTIDPDDRITRARAREPTGSDRRTSTERGRRTRRCATRWPPTSTPSGSRRPSTSTTCCVTR